MPLTKITRQSPGHGDDDTTTSDSDDDSTLDNETVFSVVYSVLLQVLCTTYMGELAGTLSKMCKLFPTKSLYTN